MKTSELFESNRLTFITIPDKTTFAKIKSDCSNIIQVYKNAKKFLYRGEASANMPKLYRAFIRKDRKPVEMQLDRHEDFNKMMTSLGYDAHRGNSIFTTGNKAIASDWGRLCVIFPTNGFKFTWFDNNSKEYIFNNIDHFYNVISEKMFNRLIKSGKEGLTNRLPEARKDAASSVFNQTILEQIEMYLKFGFDKNDKPRSYVDFKDLALRNFIDDDLNPVDTNLGRAVSDGEEVLFSDCEYYGLPMDMPGFPGYHEILGKILN